MSRLKVSDNDNGCSEIAELLIIRSSEKEHHGLREFFSFHDGIDGIL